MSAARVRPSPDVWALVAIAVAVLLANLPYLLGFFEPNPLDARSGLTSAITHGLLGGRPTIDPANGFNSQAIGHLAALDLLHLHLPWWNPYEATGMPLAGETQAAALFPPTLLTAFSNGQLYEHILFELIAGTCTYLLLRRLVVTRPAALAGAIVFALNGKFAWFSDAGVNPLPFLPMLLLGIELAFAAARQGRAGGWRLIGVAGALSVYAGFPEVAYIDVLVAVCWFGWRCGCLERGQLRRFVTKAALGALAGTLLATPMLLAMLSYLPHAALGLHGGTKLGSRHLDLSELPQLLMPYVYGPLDAVPRSSVWVEVGGYMSTSLLLFAVLGLFSPGRRGLKLVLVGWTVLAFARMYDQPPLLGHVIGVLPAMSRVQFYRYGTAALELPVIVLATLGLDDLARLPGHRRRLLWGVLGTMVVVMAAALYAWSIVESTGTQFAHDRYFDASVVWAALIPALAAAVAVLRRVRVRAALLTLLVAVDALVLFAVPQFSAPRRTTIDLAPVTYLRRHLGESRFFTLGPIDPNYGSYFGLASFGVEDFPPESYVDYVRDRLDPFAAFTGFQLRGPPPENELVRHLRRYASAGVRYVLTPAARVLPVKQTTLRLVFRSPSTKIYELAHVSPYFGAPGCRVTSSNLEAAWLTCRRPTTLIRRETWFAGWSAELDGRPTAVHRMDGLYQAVSVPAGSHHVTFSFTPPGMGWGWLGLLGGCALMCTPAVSRRLARGRSGAKAQVPG
jgi:hypothetical protein